MIRKSYSLRLASSFTLVGTLVLGVAAMPASAANNWSPAPAASVDQAAPTYIDTPKNDAPVWSSNQSTYAPDDLDAQLSGISPAVPAPMQPAPESARAVQYPPISELGAVIGGYGLQQPYSNQQPRPYQGGRGPYSNTNGANPRIYNAQPYSTGPYAASPYRGVPYGGLARNYPYNTSQMGPFGNILPAGGFPFFGPSAFGFN